MDNITLFQFFYKIHNSFLTTTTGTCLLTKCWYQTVILHLVNLIMQFKNCLIKEIFNGDMIYILDVPVPGVLEIFGEYFFQYCLQHGYDKMLRTLGDNFESFIQNLDSLHSLLAMSYKNIDAPSFR